MVKISQAGIKAILTVVEEKIVQLQAIEALPESNQPSDFDRNDVVLMEMAAEVLKPLSLLAQPGKIDIPLQGKPLRFVLHLIPDFLREHASSLSQGESQELHDLYLKRDV